MMLSCKIVVLNDKSKVLKIVFSLAPPFLKVEKVDT